MIKINSFKIAYPVTGQEIEIRVEPATYERLLKYKPTDFANLITCYYVLNSPKRIFANLQRPCRDTSDYLCFVGKPQEWYVGNRNKVPFPENLVYAVFLNDRYSIIEFGAEEISYNDKYSPENWEDRFGDLIWTRNS